MRLIFFLVLLACFQPFDCAAQDSSSSPGAQIDTATLRMQEKADGLYERADYGRAFFIYRNELAPIGDKYAQYMVGFMYLTGQGVPEDRIAASAWYRLAAERGTEKMVRIRDGLVKALDAEQMAQSDRVFVELRKQYADLVLLLDAVRADQQLLQERTGSRLASGSSAMLIVDPDQTGSMQSGALYYGEIEQRLQARLELIAAQTKIEIIDINRMNFSTLESKVDQHLEEFD